MASPSTARREAAAGRPPRFGLAERGRIAVRVAMLVAVLIFCVTAHYLWLLVRRRSPWPRRFLGSCAHVAGARVERVGAPLAGRAVFVSNHVSWLDILSIAGASGAAFVAKAEIAEAPLVGWLSRMNNTVFVAREDRLGVAAQVETVRAAVLRDQPVTLFPEGTTTDGRSLLPFKAPLLKMLEPPPPGVRVQPILLDYGDVGPEIAWIGEETGMNNALRILARRGGFRLRVVFLEPFDPANFAGRKAITAEARARIEAALAGVLGRPVEAYAGHDAWEAGDPALQAHR